ncbi:MAG: NAD+ synthase [Desulfurococcales archaeon]|nr:NAD+ synthase [Desulfurococcales archaeon]
MDGDRISISIDDLININYNVVKSHLTSFIKRIVSNANAEGVVVGLSGGVDSSTSFMLAVDALGPSRVMGLIMPDSTITPEEDVEDAKSLASIAGVEFHVIDIAPIVDVYKSTIPIYVSEEGEDRIPVGNLRARIRMSLLYYYANRYNLLVLGTGDRSEILIGYYTKYGDGAVDLLPLAVLYKTQVRRLAKQLGVPDKIAFKPSSPRLWKGHEAEKELGITYETIDVILHAVFDRGLAPSQVPEATGISRDIVDRVMEMHRRSEHKRRMPPSPELKVIQDLMLNR